MVIVFVSIYVLWSKIFLWCSFNPFHSPPLHLMSWSCPENIVTVWKMFFCSSFVVKITDMLWEILLIQPRAGRFRFFLLPIYMRWNSFLPAIFWWMGWCQAEFADLLLQALARVLTDGWTLISSNWWCQLGMFTFHSELKINTVMNCINFFLPVSLVSLCKESLTGQFVPQEMERKEQCTRTLLTYSLLMAFTIANLNHRESRKYLYS